MRTAVCAWFVQAAGCGSHVKFEDDSGEKDLLGGAGRRLFTLELAPEVIEQEFRRAMAISAGDPSIFFARPLSLFFLALVTLMVFVPLLRRWRKVPSVDPTLSVE